MVKIGLDCRGRKGDMYCNFSQLRLGDPKGLPSFFAYSDHRWANQPATDHEFGRRCPPNLWLIQNSYFILLIPPFAAINPGPAARSLA